MTDSKHLFFAIAGALLVLVLGGALLVWPNYRETRAVRQEITKLQQKISALADQTGVVASLSDELKQARQRVEEELKFIPRTSDVAGLMRKLSLPVDGRTVLDQTFTAGSPCDAAVGETFTERAMPLTVDLEATFDSVFALIRAAELMDRLVRVSSVRMAAERQGDGSGVPVLTASVGLEVIYDPPSVEEGS